MFEPILTRLLAIRRMVREAAEEAGQELVGTGVAITAFELAGLQLLAPSLSDWLDRQVRL